ncbi:MAG: hypothetical protein ACR5K4_00975 [Sodalis sp. (in: enterobacteria)]
MDKEIHLPTNIWNNLNIAFVIFLACGTVNVYIVF